MRTTTRYTDFTITENNDGWLIECYDTEREEPTILQLDYWDGMRYVMEVRDCKKAEAMAWISDTDNIGELNDLLADYINSKY